MTRLLSALLLCEFDGSPLLLLSSRNGDWLANLNFWTLSGLAFANIPVYLAVGWLVFDDFGSFLKSGASFLKSQRNSGTLDQEFDGEMAGAALEVTGFLIVCGAVIAGEYYLIERFWR